jgi:hypothetical protein
VKYTIPVLSISLVVLLVFACGCTVDSRSKTDAGNLSSEVPGTPSVVTIAPTGTDNTESPEPTVPVETIVSKMITIVPTSAVSQGITPGTATTTVDLGCLGTTNCHFYEQCMDGCRKNGVTNCEKVCCSSHCLDLPSDKQPACANACLTGATGTTVPTLIPLISPTDTLAPLETATLAPL